MKSNRFFKKERKKRNKNCYTGKNSFTEKTSSCSNFSLCYRDPPRTNSGKHVNIADGITSKCSSATAVLSKESNTLWSQLFNYLPQSNLAIYNVRLNVKTPSLRVLPMGILYPCGATIYEESWRERWRETQMDLTEHLDYSVLSANQFHFCLNSRNWVLFSLLCSHTLEGWCPLSSRLSSGGKR